MSKKRLSEVKLKTTSKITPCFIKTEEKIKKGDEVLVETDQGQEIGEIIEMKRKKQGDSEDNFQILRKLAEEDKFKFEELKDEAREAIGFVQKRALFYKLPMKIVDADYTLDKKKLVFYFQAPERLDFRELVSDLASHFNKLIRLQQIGPRDSAKILGGIGPCGRPLCCQTFLKNLESVTMEMAKTQDLLSISSSKISGLCGKLLCCLAYEEDLYKKLKKKLPKVDQIITTEKGKGKVIAQNVIKQSVLVEFQDGGKVEVYV